MNDFSFYNPSKIYFGSDYTDKLTSEVKNFKKVLVMFGSDRIKRNGLFDKVTSAIKAAKASFFELGGVKPNSPLGIIREGIAICKKENIDLILSIGGGSVIDAGKAVAIGAVTEEDIWDVYAKGLEVKAALPLGVILTVSATGSEASPASVIENLETSEKRVCESELIYPKFSILDPKETHSLPADVTFAGVVDMLSHIMERYFSNTKNTDLTDALCEATMRTIIKNSRIILKDLKNAEARAELMLSAMIAHNGVLGMGREEDWASHRIAHEITASFGTAHGDTLAMVIPEWMKHVYKNNIPVFARFARNVFLVKEADDTKAAELGIKAYEDYLSELGKDIDVSTFDVDDKVIEDMTMRAIFYDDKKTLGRFVKLGKTEIIEIYKKVFYR